MATVCVLVHKWAKETTASVNSSFIFIPFDLCCCNKANNADDTITVFTVEKRASAPAAVVYATAIVGNSQLWRQVKRSTHDDRITRRPDSTHFEKRETNSQSY